MACPVCSGAFSWKEDLLRHFGAVHHLEELVAHLESEFTGETCPQCCRVPLTLFKNLLPMPASRMPSSARVGETAQCAEGNQFSATECSQTGSPAHKMPRSDGAHVNGDDVSRKSASRSSPRRRSSDICVESIERYHCDLCEFSANDIHQLLEHGSEYHSQTPPVPPTPDGLTEAVSDETGNDCSPRQQVRERHFCDFCPYSSKWQQNVRKHMDVHKRSTLVKVGYKCAYCNMVSVQSWTVQSHQRLCHHDQPIKVLRITDGKVVKGSTNFDSVLKTVKSKSSNPSSCSAAKKQSKLNSSAKRNSDVCQKTVTNEQSALASTLNMDEASSCDHEGSAEALERKLPEQMIYWNPVCCPLCKFSSRARVNLVRHIRLSHNNQQQSQTTTPRSYPSNITGTNHYNVHLDKSTTLSLQV